MTNLKNNFGLITLAIAATLFFVSSVQATGRHDHTSHHKYYKWKSKYFQRVATFPVYENLDLNAGDELEDETAAEISAASRDGSVLYYSDSPKERVGLINIQNPSAPQAAGAVQLDGEPTSVAVRGDYLLVAVNTSVSFAQPSGKLLVYDIKNPLNPIWVKDFDMRGQPDAIAISPDNRYAAIVVENERDEDFDGGLIPQLPAGHLVSLRIRGPVKYWKAKIINLSGYADVAPEDPEPEYVDINRANIAAVTLQENNYILLVSLRHGKVIKGFSAGSADLFGVDTMEDDVINPIDSIFNRRREPDAIAWLNDWSLVTANEGDYEDENGEGGGSRGFTVFNMRGNVKYESGSSMEHELIRAGHYPESRSENKGIEPESVHTDRFGRDNFLFVGSERGNMVAVYKTSKHREPKLHQLLPTTIGPEGILTIPSRGLLVVSSEKDDADEGFRSTITIYQYGKKVPSYPRIQSSENQLLPWGALSGMSADNDDVSKLFAVPDSYYAQSRIFTLDVSSIPAEINGEIVLSKNGGTVDYDLEGIAQREDGSFWLVSEGKGSNPNLLIHALSDGTVMDEITLPKSVRVKQKKNGFEGVAVVGSGAEEKVLVAFQREWKKDLEGFSRIGIYTPASGEWGFFYYPLESASTGWVGLSELSAIDDENFVVIERDNQQGPSAKIKRMYRFSIAGLTPVAEGGGFPMLEKTLVHDLLPDLQTSNGWVLDKVEGTAIAADGQVYVVTDNDGVDDASGETQFLYLGNILD